MSRLASRRPHWLALLTLLTAAWPCMAQTRQVLEPTPEGRSFDARIELHEQTLQEQLQPPTLQPAQKQAIEALYRQAPDLLIHRDPVTGIVRSLVPATGFLTRQPLAGDPESVALDFLRQNLGALELSVEDLEDRELTDSVFSKVSGSTHLYYRQVHRGIAVYNGQLQVNVHRDGHVLGVHNSFVPGLETAADAFGARPELTAARAVDRALEHAGLEPGRKALAASTPSGPRRTTRIDPTGLSRSPIEAQLMWLPITRDEVRLVWNFNIATLDGRHWYDFTVDAHDGKVWTRFDWTSDATYRVYPQPVESPNHTSPTPPSDGRELVTNPQDSTASPNGWHSTGATSWTILRGNNVHAYEDRNDTDSPPVSEPDCGASLDCDFPIDLTQAPADYIPAAVTNLFYWNNLIHDVQYQYGFDEAAGNFQVNNFGRGGAGNDDVQAEAQDGSGVNNANFATPPDGFRPRMQMFVWTAPSPDKDGDLDNGIVIHEYGHGISNRQVGGPSSSSCLQNFQQPGEGWSDWFALAYTAEPGDAGTDKRGIGTYALNQPTTGEGIRNQPYSTDPSLNDWTYATISTGISVPHGVGAVWAQALWEVYWKLVDQWGFDPDLYDAQGGAGNQRAMLYVNEGLKNTACSPTFLQARDGILQAAQSLHNGEDVCRLWDAFAAFGLGVDAVTLGPNSVTAINGFNIPESCGGLSPPPPGGCTNPTAVYGNDFDNATGLSDWSRGIFVLGGSTADWRGVQTCTASSGSNLFRFGGTGCTTDYGNDNFTFAQPNGSGGITIPTNSHTTRLTFNHRRNFESGFDGATLTLSLNGGSYFFVPSSVIVSGGYNGNLLNGCPPAAGAVGAQVWTGDQVSFGATEVDLDAMCNLIAGSSDGCAGQNVGIGFTSITDCGVTDDGWFLDDVEVSVCTGCIHLIDLALQSIGTTEVFEACDSIGVGPSFEVLPSGDVTLRAGNRVVFRDGTAIGGRLKVVIDPSL